MPLCVTTCTNKSLHRVRLATDLLDTCRKLAFVTRLDAGSQKEELIMGLRDGSSRCDQEANQK